MDNKEIEIDKFIGIVEAILHHDFKDHLTTLKSKVDVLDIGCNNGPYWFDLYNEIHFNKIIGIDSKEIEIRNTYERFLNLNPTTNLTEEEFNSTFVLQDMTDVFNYFNKNEGQTFDLIIISNCIYLLNIIEQIELLNEVKPFLKDNGFLYIRSNDSGYTYRLDRQGMEIILLPELNIKLSDSTGGFHNFHFIAKKEKCPIEKMKSKQSRIYKDNNRTYFTLKKDLTLDDPTLVLEWA